MKKLLLIVTIPLLVIVLAIAALLFFVDPNQFKPLIVEQTKKHTGMDLVVEGDISWRFFPSLGLSLGQTELRNPSGFKHENLLKINAIDVDVSVMPLLDNELYIGNILLDGAEIYLETKKDGTSNLDALTKSSQPDGSAQPSNNTPSSENQVTEASPAEDPLKTWSINLAGVSVTNARLEIQDDKAGNHTQLYDVGLSVSQFQFDQWSTAEFEAKGKNNQQTFATNGGLEIKLSADMASYQLRNIVVDSRFNDPTTDISSAKVELKTFDFDKANPLTVTVKGHAANLDIDLQLASELLVDKAISQIRLEKMALNSTFSGASLPQNPMKITADSNLGFDTKASLLSVGLNKLTLNDIQLDGKATVKLLDIPQVRFTLHSPDINLDAFMGTEGKTASTDPEQKTSTSTQGTDKPKSSSTAPEAEPDLTALNTLDVKGEVSIDKFKANNAKMEKVVTKFSVNRGVADLTSFTSQLYQGNISASAQLDARSVPATYWAKKQISGVKVQPLLKDVADNEMLEGTGNIDVNVTGKSLTSTGIKQNLAGTVKINFADGAVNGVNIAQLIRVNYAKLRGKTVDDKVSQAKKTDFSAMKATLTLSKGVMTTNDLSASSPLLRVKGKGSANYLKETMDFHLETSVVGSLKGQGGKDIDELKDITIPVRLYNTWSEPKYEVEFDQLWKQLEKEKKKELEQKAEKELDRLLGDKVKDEKTKAIADKLLKGLFN